MGPKRHQRSTPEDDTERDSSPERPGNEEKGWRLGRPRLRPSAEPGNGSGNRLAPKRTVTQKPPMSDVQERLPRRGAASA